MKKFFTAFAFIFTAIVLMTSCSTSKTPSCELTLDSTENTVSYSLEFLNLDKKQDTYKIEILKGEVTIDEEISSVDITAGQFNSLDFNVNYTVKVYLTNKEEYDLEVASKDILTKKGTIVGVVFNSQSFVYDGKAKSLAVENLPDGATVTYEGNEKVEVGEYTVTATIQKENYNDLELSAQLKITPASLDFEIANKTVVYDGESHTITATTDLELSYEYYLGDTKLDAAPVNAGVYTVKAIYAGDKNHEKVEKTATLTINKADSSISANDIIVKFGEEYTILATCTVSSAVLDFEYFSGNTQLTESPTEIGSYSIIIHFAGNENYKGCSKTIALLITNPDNKDVIISLDNIETVYGQEYAVLPSVDQEEVSLSDLVIKYYTLDGREIAKPVNAGDYEVTISYAGNDEKYLNPATKRVTLTIAKADYDLSHITFEDVTYTYDGVEKTLIITGTLPEGVTVTYQDNTLLNAGYIMATAIFTGVDTDNYNLIPNKVAKLTIEKADPSLEGLQVNFINDYTPGMTIEVFKERLDAKNYYLEDYTVVLQSGVNKITVLYKLGDNYNEVEIEVTLTCNAMISGFNVTDGGRQIQGRNFDSGNLVITYLYNDGTSQVVTPAFTTSAVSNTTTKFTVEVTITDSKFTLEENTKSVEITPIAAPEVMIYAVYGAGGNSGAIYKNDFIILYNASEQDIDLTGWSLQYAAATATTAAISNIAKLEGTIKAYGFYTIVAAAGTASVQDLPFLSTADSTNNLALAANNFQLYLSTTATPIIPNNYSQYDYVDMVGAGTATNKEGAVAPAPTTTSYIQRKELKDTNNNAVDFELVDFNGTNDFDFLAEGHRAYNYAKTFIEAQDLDFNNLPLTFKLPMSYAGVTISWVTENVDNLSIAADGTVTVSKDTECDGKLFGTIEGYALGFEYLVFISNKIRLDSPEISLSHFTLTWEAVDNADSYDIYIDGVKYTNTTNLSYNLYDINFANNFAEIKEYAISVVARCAEGSQQYVDSVESSEVFLKFADTHDLSTLDKTSTYIFKVVVTEKGVSLAKPNFFAVDPNTGTGFLVYQFTNQADFDTLEKGRVVYISGKYAEFSSMPEIMSITNYTITDIVSVDEVDDIVDTKELTKEDVGYRIALTDAVVVSKTDNLNVVVSVGENQFNLYANATYLNGTEIFATLLPGNTIDFTGGVGIYNSTIQIYVTSLEVTDTDVSNEYKFEVSLPEALAKLKSSYTSGSVVDDLLANGITYADVEFSYSVEEGSATISGTTLTFGTVEEATTVKIKVVASVNGVTQEEIKTILLNSAGADIFEEQVIYSTGFESSEGFVASTTYNNVTPKGFGPAEQQWLTYYGTATTNSPVKDSQSMQMRWYTSATANLGYTVTNFDLDRVTQLSFAYKSTSGIKLQVSYSLDAGTTWIEYEVFDAKTVATDATIVFDQELTGNVRFKFSIVLPDTAPTATSQLHIDNVVIKGNVLA